MLHARFTTLQEYKIREEAIVFKYLVQSSLSRLPGLAWSEVDEDAYSEKSRTISGILQGGKELFLELQFCYL